MTLLRSSAGSIHGFDPKPVPLSRIVGSAGCITNTHYSVCLYILMSRVLQYYLLLTLTISSLSFFLNVVHQYHQSPSVLLIINTNNLLYFLIIVCITCYYKMFYIKSILPLSFLTKDSTKRNQPKFMSSTNILFIYIPFSHPFFFSFF